ncbi:T9SS type B sorting domain-containing protein [Chryseobacterium scophthalmum]|uniref:Gliding motility-associated C-terminal domain-containing protein n=1 Tax=Chryseobacterium scophthalmum TaxID=59733 RepID=A0A1N6INL4_9FLAO|nr:T9SS type B sorting domain-containing protein [Chryseobacterium scophthalmum]SIO33621.1 gliding motility-associated C-terminal domain-containing protein [Chryseobacterium scophthalmum]
MKKTILFFILLFFSFYVKAQRDTEHWFAPMKQSYFTDTNKQALFLSTDSTVPFAVNIYNNNILLGTVTISKGSPVLYDIPKDFMMTNLQSGAFAITSRGLYVKGEKPFFCTFRFSVDKHGEILTSKGKAGIGTKFYAGYAPLSVTNPSFNFTSGILATEDNTTVTISGYNSSVKFSNGTIGASNPTMTFTLNKGQSYVIEGNGDVAGNLTGFIGAKIVANKPVSVTNGNFNGQHTLIGNGAGGLDIYMDQSIPIERLGDEYILMKGMAPLSYELEGAVVVATENGTQVYVNDETTPIATLNEGQFYRIGSTSFISQNFSGHYNMRIKSTKKIYVYQLMSGGGAGTYYNTGGANYIPPVNCFLPKKIDEIGLINKLPYFTAIDPKVRLNIITESGATVSVNGTVLSGIQGPYPVTGNPNWQTYSVENVTGNITVQSTKAVTAGIAAGHEAVGYGGYFAGFSSIPVIAKTNGNCIPGMILEVDDSYATYQWNFNGNPIPGATTNTYSPTHAGNYTVTVSVGGTCPPATTPVFEVVMPPQIPSLLTDKVICIDERTTLDAGSGFESYEWSTGETTQTLSNVGVGKYSVTLKYNGCFNTYDVEVKAAPKPVIQNIDLQNNTATITTIGGKSPYSYSINGINWQSSNVFTNLPNGQNTFYVKDAYNCEPVKVELTLINIINAITPNGDNINDKISYSDLKYKKDLSFSVYDRYGNQVFKGTAFNNYTWDGKSSNKKMLTGSYWYEISWKEPSQQNAIVKYTGWILVKNMN